MVRKLLGEVEENNSLEDFKIGDLNFTVHFSSHTVDLNNVAIKKE